MADGVCLAVGTGVCVVDGAGLSMVIGAGLIVWVGVGRGAGGGLSRKGRLGLVLMLMGVRCLYCCGDEAPCLP